MPGLTISLSIQALSSLTGLNRTQAALQRLQKTASDVKVYRKASEAVMQSGRAYRSAQQAVDALVASRKAGTISLATFNARMKKAAAEVRTSREAFREQNRALRDLRTRLTGAGVDVTRLGAAEASLRQRIEQTNRSLVRRRSVLDATSRIARSSANGFLMVGKGLAYANLAFGALRGVASFISSIVSPFIGFAADMEKYEFQLSAMLGSRSAGKEALQWVRDFAKENPAAPITDMADAFSMMTQFGMPARDMMKSVVDYNAALGGSAENLRGIVLQLGQAWSKGAIQSQDAIPLLQRGVNIYRLLADYTKRVLPADQQHDAGYFAALSSKGGLGRDAITAIMEQMEFEQKDKAKEVGNTWNGLMNQLTLQWQQFQGYLMDAGVFDMLKQQLQRLSTWLKEQSENGNLKKWAAQINDEIVPAIQKLGNALAKLLENTDKIGKVFSMLGWVGDHAPTAKLSSALLNLAAGDTKATRKDLLAMTPAGWFMGEEKPTLTSRAQETAKTPTLAPGAGVLAPQAQARLLVTVEDKLTRVHADSDNNALLAVDTLVGRNLAGVM